VCIPLIRSLFLKHLILNPLLHLRFSQETYCLYIAFVKKSIES